MSNMNPAAVGGLIGTGAGALIGGPIGAQIGGSVGGLAGSLFGGDDGVSKEALDMLKQAQARIMAIPVPTADDMKLILQPLVQKGVLTPDQYQTILAKPTEFLNINLDPTSREAEMGALNELQQIGKEGGMDANFRNAMNEARNEANTQFQGQRGAILQNAAERGTLNSNLTAADQLAQASQDAYNLNSQTTQAAADAENRALQAILASGQLGGQINSQDYQQAADRAKAIDAINAYNAQNSQAQSNLNTQTNNAAQQFNLELAQNIAQYNNQNQNEAAKYNAQLPQQIFSDKLSQAGAAAGVALPTASLLQQGYQNKNALQGNLVGSIGTAIGNYGNNQNLSNAIKAQNSTPQYTPPQSTAYQNNVNQFAANNGYNPPMAMFSEGGRVPGHARVPGDSPMNDTVPARLSPGEVVVPRSAAHDPVRLAAFAAHVANRKPDIHPDDIKSVLQALTKHREGFSHGGMVYGC